MLKLFRETNLKKKDLIQKPKNKRFNRKKIQKNNAHGRSNQPKQCGENLEVGSRGRVSKIGILKSTFVAYWSWLGMQFVKL